MHSKDLLNWLEKGKLLPIARNHSVHFKNVLKKSLKVKNEDVLIISDYGLPRHRVAPLMSGAYYLAAKNLGFNVYVVMQDVKKPGDSADSKVISILKRKSKPSVVVFNLSNKIGSLGNIGKSYRRHIKERKHRFVSALGMASMCTNDFYSITRALNIDYVKFQRECAKLKKALDWGREVVVKTDAGTDLKVNITGCKGVSNDGQYNFPGSGGNMPVGEVYIPPKLNTAEGRAVVDCSSKNNDGTLLIKNPIILTVKKGLVVNIDGGYEAMALKSSVLSAEKQAKRPAVIRQLGELGVGMNPKASVVGAVAIDEKVLGTAHVALGSNYWFGGDVFTLVHFDQVFKNPKIFIDDKEYKLPKKSDLL